MDRDQRNPFTRRSMTDPEISKLTPPNFDRQWLFLGGRGAGMAKAVDFGVMPTSVTLVNR